MLCFLEVSLSSLAAPLWEEKLIAFALNTHKLYDCCKTCYFFRIKPIRSSFPLRYIRNITSFTEVSLMIR